VACERVAIRSAGGYAQHQNTPLYKYQNGRVEAWRLYLEKDSPFVAVGADFDENGRSAVFT